MYGGLGTMDRRGFLGVIAGFFLAILMRMGGRKIIPEYMLKTNKKLLG